MRKGFKKEERCVSIGPMSNRPTPGSLGGKGGKCVELEPANGKWDQLKPAYSINTGSK